jgi:hypothetical protein
MKVVCINNDTNRDNYESTICAGNHIDLTINRVYDVLKSDDYAYFVINDIGYKYAYYKKRFITINKYRCKKLKNLEFVSNSNSIVDTI